MKKIIVIIICSLFSGIAMSQGIRKNVSVNGVNYPLVIDFSAMSEKTKYTLEELRNNRESSDNWAMQTHTDDYRVRGIKVSPIFAVAPADVNSKGEPQQSVTNDRPRLNWNEAREACRLYKGINNDSSEQGKWRLPSLREMMWIVTLGWKDFFYGNSGSVNNFVGFSKTGERWYWTDTKSTGNETKIWAVYCVSGGFDFFYIQGDGAQPKGEYVRCIRDLVE